jgi:acyl-CoA thioester hydrolase
MDCDPYGHVNNVEYYSYFDTALTDWLVREACFDWKESDAIGLCVESGCRFAAPLGFPERIDAGVRVVEVGKSSVRYEIALFAEAAGPAPAGSGHFVHVYVDRRTRRPVPVPAAIRSALERILVAPAPPAGG